MGTGSSTPWLIISAGALILVLFAVAVLILLRKKQAGVGHKPDYYTFFVMGIVWLGAGIPLKNPGLWVMGLVFIAVGLVHKDQWKENHRSWKDLNESEKKFKLWLTLGLLVLVLIGFLAFFFYGF